MFMCRRKLVLLVLGLMLVVAFTPMGLANVVDDDAGLHQRIVHILDKQLQWEPSSYRLEVERGEVTLYLFKDDVAQRQQVEHVLGQISGLKRLYIATMIVDTQDRDKKRGIAFPVGDVFRPLVADQKEPHFFVSYVKLDQPGEDFMGALVGLGANFGLYRWPGKRADEGWQFSWFAVALSQFNLDQPSDDLINTDYLVGFPLSYRRKNFSLRARIYHQSSHLGDEFITSGTGPQPINLSIEVVDALLAWQYRGLRLYGGGGYIFHRDPSDLEPGMNQFGIDYRSPRPVIAGKRLIAGVDAKWLEELNWKSSTSIKVGIEFGQSRPARRGVNLMLEAYDGFAPFGQLFARELSFYGVGLHFDF